MMKYALLAVGVALTLAVSANVVQGIIFKDGSFQDTAAYAVNIQSGTEFSEYVYTGGSVSFVAVGATVPSGKELVVLKVQTRLASNDYYELNATNEIGATPIALIFSSFIAIETTYGTSGGNDFPNGAVVIGAGDWITITHPTGLNFVGGISIHGYYRNV